MSDEDEKTPESGEGSSDNGALWRLGYAVGGVAVLVLVVWLGTLLFNGDDTDPNEAAKQTHGAALRFTPEKQYDATKLDPRKVETCRLVGNPVATTLRLKLEPGQSGLSCKWSYVDFDPKAHYTLQAKVDPDNGLPAGKTEKIGRHQALRDKAADRCTVAFALSKSARIDMTVTGGPDACNRIDVAATYLENWLPVPPKA